MYKAINDETRYWCLAKVGEDRVRLYSEPDGKVRDLLVSDVISKLDSLEICIENIDHSPEFNFLLDRSECLDELDGKFLILEIIETRAMERVARCVDITGKVRYFPLDIIVDPERNKFLYNYIIEPTYNPDKQLYWNHTHSGYVDIQYGSNIQSVPFRLSPEYEARLDTFHGQISLLGQDKILKEIEAGGAVELDYAYRVYKDLKDLESPSKVKRVVLNGRLVSSTYYWLYRITEGYNEINIDKPDDLHEFNLGAVTSIGISYDNDYKLVYFIIGNQVQKVLRFRFNDNIMRVISTVVHNADKHTIDLSGFLERHPGMVISEDNLIVNGCNLGSKVAVGTFEDVMRKRNQLHLMGTEKLFLPYTGDYVSVKKYNNLWQSAVTLIVPNSRVGVDEWASDPETKEQILEELAKASIS